MKEKGLMEDFKEQEEGQKELLESDEYINWLINACKEHDITDNPILKNNDSNINKLSLFYKIVSTYAKSNYILPMHDGNITSYAIAYNNDVLLIRQYKIASLSIYVCSNVTEYQKFFKDHIIDFNDIRFNKKRADKDAIDDAINDIKDSISYLKQVGIPKEYLEKIVNYEIQREDNHHRKLNKTIH